MLLFESDKALNKQSEKMIRSISNLKKMQILRKTLLNTAQNRSRRLIFLLEKKNCISDFIFDHIFLIYSHRFTLNH
jgi:hypothetical protein